MTVFGTDLSDYDWSRGPLDLASMHADGVEFVTHKATEGVAGRHVHYGQVLDRARAAGVPVLGAYHVVRSLGSLADQVRAHIAYLDEATPWWRTWPAWIEQVDLELWPYDKVAGSTGTAFAELLAAATGKWVVIYASKGQYGNGLGGSRPLWNAVYPSGAAGHYRDLYPGDNGVGWQSYSGRTPVFWQYSSNAQIGSQPGCDANAFRGSLADLLALMGNPSISGDDMLPIESAKLDAIYNLADTETLDPAQKPFQVPITRVIKGIAADVAAVKAAVAAPVPVVLSADQLAQVVAAVTGALQGIVPTTEEIAATVDAAVKARLDGATVHTAGS